jgi:hypothetical protein
MRYLIFSVIFLLSSCALQSPRNLLDKDSIKTDVLEHIIDTDGEEFVDNSDSTDTDIFSNNSENSSGNGSSSQVSESKYYSRDERVRVVYKDVVRNSTSEKVINSQSDLGQVIYKVPDTMIVRKNYEVVVRISKSRNNIEIRSNLNGKITSKNIKTSNKMSVELIDPIGDIFQIKEVNIQKQLVDSSYTEWKYNIMPLKSGQNKLDLVISIYKDDDVKQIVYSDDIYVQSNAPAQIKSFWYDNWKWSIETLIIPIITWLFGLWWGKRSEKRKRRRY